MSRIDRPPFAWQQVRKSNGQMVSPGDAYDMFHQLMTAEYSPIIELKPLPTIDPIRNKVDTVNGSVQVINGQIEIDGTLGLTSLYSRDYGRYLPGITSLVGIGVGIPDPNNGTYEFGYGNNSGNRFGLEIVDGEWYTFVESGGDRYYRRHRSEWLDPLDGTGPSGINIDLKDFVLRMPFGWYGFLSVQFTIAVADRERGDHIIMVDATGHEDGRISIEQPNLPIFASANGGVLNVGGRQFGVLGRYKPQPRSTITPLVTKTVGTEYTPIVSITPKSDVNWRGIPTRAAGVDLLNSESAEYVVFFHENDNLTGAFWQELPNTLPDSVSILYDEDATAISLTEVYKLYGGILAASGKGNVRSANKEDFPDVNIPFGVTVTIAARAAAGATTSEITGMLKIREDW